MARDDSYTLIDLDGMEQSVVRRHLRRWSKSDQDATPLIHELQQRQHLANLRIFAPRYETNVYPLYYYCLKQVGKHRQVYDHVFQTLPTTTISLPEEDVRAHIGHTVDSEIDILVEDADYFVFIEAKEVGSKRKVKFEKKRGVHQLVHQYVQGKILEMQLFSVNIRKTFALATVGANKGETLELPLNPTEQTLMKLVGEEKNTLSVVDLSWNTLAGIATTSALSEEPDK